MNERGGVVSGGIPDAGTAMVEDNEAEYEEVFSKLRSQTGIHDIDELVTSLSKRNDPTHVAEMASAKESGEARVASLTKEIVDRRAELAEISMTGVSSATRVADKFDAPLLARACLFTTTTINGALTLVCFNAVHNQ